MPKTRIDSACMDARRSRGPWRSGARVGLLTLLGLACVAGAGCGDDDTSGAESSTTPGETRQVEIPAEAQDDQQALTAEPVEGDFQGVSFEAYDESVTEIVSLLDEYWAEALPEAFGAEYTPPDDVIAYYPEEGSPKCDGEPLGPENAFYCPGGNTDRLGRARPDDPLLRGGRGRGGRLRARPRVGPPDPEPGRGTRVPATRSRAS